MTSCARLSFPRGRDTACRVSLLSPRRILQEPAPDPLASALLEYGLEKSPLERVLVSGVSGPIGAALLPYLESQGARIIRLVRGPTRGADQISWDPLRPLSSAALSGFEAVIHLAGETVAARWTPAKKKAILESRVQGTKHLPEALAQTSSRPRVFICASAIGYYGNRGDEFLTEASPSGEGFLPEVTREWESAIRTPSAAGIRT